MSKKRIVLDVLALVSLIVAVVIYEIAESAWQQEAVANHWSGLEALSMYDMLLAFAVVFLIVFWRSLVCLVCAGGPVTKTVWRALPSDVGSYFWILVLALPILRIIHAAVWFKKHMSENEGPHKAEIL